MKLSVTQTATNKQSSNRSSPLFGGQCTVLHVNRGVAMVVQEATPHLPSLASASLWHCTLEPPPLPMSAHGPAVFCIKVKRPERSTLESKE